MVEGPVLVAWHGRLGDVKIFSLKGGARALEQ